MKVLFLQEYIRENHMKKIEDGTFKNVFFQTKGGRLLKKLIKDGLGLKDSEYYIDYAYGQVPKVLSRDKYGRAVKYKPPTQREANVEYEFLYRRIIEEKPDIIIPTGNIGCKALLNKSSITQLRGVPEKTTIRYTPIDEEEYENKRSKIIPKLIRTEEELKELINSHSPSAIKDSISLTQKKEELENTIRFYNDQLDEIDNLAKERTHECWVLPMFSMEYMLINPSVQNLVEADFVTLKKFIDQGDSAFEATPVDYEFVDNIERVREIFTEIVPKAEVVSWDLETNTLKPELPGAKPLVIALCWEEGTGVTIPLEHKDFTWKKEELQEIYKYISDFVADPNIIKVGHNLQFDKRFLILTKGITEFANNRDTKYMYYTLVNQDVEGSLKLSDLAYELTDMGGYDKPLEEFKKRYVKEHVEKQKQRIKKLKEEHKRKVSEDRQRAKELGVKYVPEKVTFPKAEPPKNEVDGSDFNYEWIPLKEMLHPYAAGDVDACLRIYNKLDAIGRKKENSRIRELYTDHSPKLKTALAKVEANGVQMDLDYNQTLIDAYAEEEERLVEELRKFPQVQAIEEEHRLLYQRGVEEMAIPKAERDEEIAKLRDRYKGKLKFNPNATDDKRKLLFRDTGIRLPYNKEFLIDSAVADGLSEDEIEWYHYKTNKSAIEYVGDHYEEMKPICDLLLEHSLVKTRRRNFTYKLREMVDPLGILHGGYNSEGTACVSGGTLLLTGKGIKRIDSLSSNRVQDTFEDIDIRVHSHKGIEVADGFYYNGYKKGKRIVLQDGTEIITTPNHPLLKNTHLSGKGITNTINKVFFKEHIKKVVWERAENLKEGDFIALKLGTELYGNNTEICWDTSKYKPTPTSHTKHVTIPSTVTEELAEWLGMYMAGGDIYESKESVNIVITNSSKEVRDRFTYLTERVFNLVPAESHPKHRGLEVSMASAHVGRWVKEVLGVEPGAHNKDVPDIILQGTKKVQQAFIRGLTLDSAVHKKKYPSLYFSSVSKTMVDKVRVMLLNMGIYCSRAYRKSYASNRTGVYEIMITYEYLDKYMKEIGVIESEKKKVIETKLSGYGKSKGKRAGVLISDDYVFVRVKRIEDTYDEFFDLHVPESHSFIGNGVVNHNTSRLSSQNP